MDVSIRGSPGHRGVVFFGSLYPARNFVDARVGARVNARIRTDIWFVGGILGCRGVAFSVAVNVLGSFRGGSLGCRNVAVRLFSSLRRSLIMHQALRVLAREI